MDKEFLLVILLISFVVFYLFQDAGPAGLLASLWDIIQYSLK